MKILPMSILKLSKIKTVFSNSLMSLVLLVSVAQAQSTVTQEWLQRYDFGGTSDKAVGLVLDSANNVYVTGSGINSSRSNTKAGIETIKLITILFHLF